MSTYADAAFEYQILADTLHTELARSAAKSIANDLLALDQRVLGLANDFKGQRLAVERDALISKLLNDFAPLQKRAAAMRQEANILLTGLLPKNPHSREDLAEIRAGLRSRIVSYDAMGLPRYDSAVLRGMLEVALGEQRYNIVWAILESPEQWVDADTRATVLLDMAKASNTDKADEANTLLYNAQEFERQYQRLLGLFGKAEPMIRPVRVN
jgi:hypothetical protein